MRLGLVGFPQSGRTTLLEALTGTPPADHRPDRPHIATLTVPDPRLERVREIYASRTSVPVSIEVEDLPALPVPGSGVCPGRSCPAGFFRGPRAARPDGTGRGTLPGDLRTCDALVLVIRAFPSGLVPHHRGTPDPKRDLADLKAELILADLDVASRRVERLRKELQKPLPDKHDLETELAALERSKAHLEAGGPLATLDLGPLEEKALRAFQFLSQKPHLVVFNVGDEAARSGDPALADVPGSTQIAAALERDLRQLGETERADFMAEYDLVELAGPRLVRLAYQALDAVTFYTAADKEAHAWTLTRGGTAVDAAGKVHSDLARGFIRAEAVSFADLDRAGSFKDAKAQGHVRLEGRDYVVQDGDVLFIHFSR